MMNERMATQPTPGATMDEAGPSAERAQGTMEAVLLDSYGPAERLRVGRIPIPDVHPGGVRIRVRAAGINPIDWRIRNGSLRWLLPAQFPVVLGFDVAGEIEAVGPAVSGWNVGDRVFCFLDNRHGGGYADFAVASARVLALMPRNVTWEQAAGVPLAASTALLALRDVAHVRPGQKVLVNGAAGGVGSFAVQIGVALGARVTGVCSDRNQPLVREWGAEDTIDYRQRSFTKERTTYDVVFDAVGKSSYWTCRRILTHEGCYVTTLPAPGNLAFQLLTSFHRPRCRFILARPDGDNLRYIAGLIEEGRVKPFVDAVFPFTDAAQAHRQSEAGHTRGKIVFRSP